MAIRYTSDMRSDDVQLSIRQGGRQAENHSISSTEVFFERDWCRGCIEDEKKHIQLGGHDVEFVVATSKSSSRTIFGLKYGPDNQIKIHSCDGMVLIINSKPVTVDFRCSWEVKVNVNDISLSGRLLVFRYWKSPSCWTECKADLLELQDS
jgi:hypothetical protein